MTKGWVTNLQEIEDEGKRLFGRHYFALRYEDVLNDPLREMTHLWKFLGVKKVDKSLEKKIKAELQSNPDEEWQERRNQDIASFLLKGQAGNWQRLFTARDKTIFKEIGGEMLVKWKYEKDLNW